MESLTAAPPASTHDRLVHLLRYEGEAAVEPLARTLGLTTMAVRKHLDALTAEGLVAYRTEHRPVGRPRRVYALTRAADGHFPSAYEGLTLELLQFLHDRDGEAGVTEFFRQRASRQRTQYSAELAGLPLPERVARFTALRNREGFMARHEQTADGVFIVREHNCPCRLAAEACPQICEAERRLFMDVLGTSVDLRNAIAHGGGHCEFRLTPRS